MTAFTKEVSVWIPISASRDISKHFVQGRGQCLSELVCSENPKHPDNVKLVNMHYIKS